MLAARTAYLPERSRSLVKRRLVKGGADELEDATMRLKVELTALQADACASHRSIVDVHALALCQAASC